jgi:subtilisin family serine protease
MRKLTTLILATLFALITISLSLHAAETGKMTDRLSERIATAENGEFIRINISLTEKFDSQELIRTTSKMKIGERRAYVISVLKDFSERSQSGVLAELNQMQRSETVREVTALWINNIITCYATREAIEDLLKRDDIEKIDYDKLQVVIDPEVRKNSIPEPGYSGNREITWNVLKINAHEVWALGYNGEGIVVSVIDTGVNYNHVDLATNIWTHPDYPNHGWNFVSNNNNPLDDHGHGTHCAGTVAGDGTAGSQTGMAPGASIMCLKVLNSSGSGEENYVWQAVQFSVENGAHVMSLSLGWQHSWGPDRAAFRQAFDNALAAGVISAVAAGNEGSGNAPSNVRTPGDCPPPWIHPDQNPSGEVSGVVSVGSTTSTDDISSFSSRGPVTWQTVAPYNDFPYQPEMGLLRPDIMAPGSDIKSLAHYSNTGYESGWSGTSMATPAIAGVMALMLQKSDLIEPAEMSEILETTTVVLQAGKNNVSGSGRVDAMAAVEEVSAVAKPSNLVGAVTYETGLVELEWEFEWEPGFEFFRIYRDDVAVAETTDLFYNETLPDYGFYEYKVTAQHMTGESSGIKISLQWGDAHIAVDPVEIIENIDQQAVSYRYITVENTGELDLQFNVSSSTEPFRGTNEYCVPGGNCSWGDGITSFAMGDISNLNSGCSDGGYGDFTGMSTDLEVGGEYTVTLQSAYGSQFVNIWIDANKDEVFEPNELILEGFELSNANQTYTTDVIIPDDFDGGETRMRVMAKWQSTPNDPCENMSYGEAEDYTVVLSGWMFVERMEETIAPGETATIEIMFNSEDLEEGTYYGTVVIESNDPDAPMVEVPVTLNVGDGFPLSVNVSADPSTLCMGESSQLQAGANGGTGIYTYSWTSDPPGFSSNISNPVVSPEVTTIYYVEVNDGEYSVEGEIAVTVNHTPEQASTPQGETDFCRGEEQSVFSTAGAAGATSYLWFIEPENAGTISGAGTTATVNWDESFTGMAMIMVEPHNMCGAGDMSDILEVNMHELPEVDLGPDVTVCAGETVTLDAGNAGATYLWSNGETTQTIVVDSTGVGIGTASYWVEVTGDANCTGTDEITVQFDDCTNISEIAESANLTVFPNPSPGIFTLEMGSQTKPVNVSVTNAFGTEVFSIENFNNQSGKLDINIGNQPNGIYFINIKGAEINTIQKIVVKKN